MSRKLLTYAFNQLSLIKRDFRYTRRYDPREGVRYPGGLKYYPRFENEPYKDRQYKPTKLLMIKRVKPVKGTPHWDRSILEKFKLDGKDIAIVKNIPEINAHLYRIKHLIKVTPIQTPNGVPDMNNLKNVGTYLRENGDFMISHKFSVDPAVQEATEAHENNPKRMDGNTLRRYLRKKWLSGW